jgi:hypothetical protein
MSMVLSVGCSISPEIPSVAASSRISFKAVGSSVPAWAVSSTNPSCDVPVTKTNAGSQSIASYFGFAAPVTRLYSAIFANPCAYQRDTLLSITLESPPPRTPFTDLEMLLYTHILVTEASLIKSGNRKTIHWKAFHARYTHFCRVAKCINDKYVVYARSKEQLQERQKSI